MLRRCASPPDVLYEPAPFTHLWLRSVQPSNVTTSLKVRVDRVHLMLLPGKPESEVGSQLQSGSHSSSAISSSWVPQRTVRLHPSLFLSVLASMFSFHTIVYGGLNSGTPACLPAIHRSTYTCRGSVSQWLIPLTRTSSMPCAARSL